MRLEVTPRLPARAWIIAIAGAAASLCFGIIYVATDQGRIKIEVNEPNAVVLVDGQQVRIEGLSDPITLRAGKHDLSVKRGDVEVDARRFVVHRGDNPALIVELVANKVTDAKDGSPEKTSKPANPTAPDRPVAPATATPAPPEPITTYPVNVLWDSVWVISGNDVVIKRTQPYSAVVLTKTVSLEEFTFEAEVKRIEGNGFVELHFGGARFITFGLDLMDDRTRVFFRNFQDGGMLASPEPQPMGPVDYDKWDHLKVEKKDGVIVGYVNCREFYRVADDQIASGALWLATVNADAKFRNIKATGAGGKVLLKGLPDLPKMAE